MRSALFLSLIVSLLCVTTGAFAQCPQLVWADEFDGTTLNTADWNYQTGDGCDLGICDWGNNERQFYQEANAVVSNGTLKITARLESAGGKVYTSARINTKNKQDFRYGRMEARIKVPRGSGTWPAFWMLSTDEVYGGWPQSGEIDIMEYVGRAPEEVLGTIHFGQPVPNNQQRGETYRLLEGDFYDDFHDFAVEWQPNEIRWFVDGYLYSTKRPSNLGGQPWPFDQDFHFLLNLAIGGNLGGSVDNSIFPATMEVDYVRVYDGNRPYLAGDRDLENAAANVSYRLGNVPAGTVVNWAVPSGATVVSGQGTPAIRIDWGSTGGTIAAAAELPCGTQTLELEVAVAAPFVKAFSFENFDDEPLAVLNYTDGTLTEVNNPTPNDINDSPLSGRYERNGDAPFDVMVYNVNSIDNANEYLERERQFVMDVLTQAPIGTEIIIQLETNAALPGNFPTGRHSRYRTQITERGNWHRLGFVPLDQPDPAAGASSITRMVILFRPNSTSSNTFFFDNLDSYTEAEITNTTAIPTDGLDLTLVPNPATDRIWVNFALAERAEIQLAIFDLRGRRVGTLPRQELPAGNQQLEVPLGSLTAGVYSLQLRVGTAVRNVRFVKH